jgi:hypothetical protein
MVYNHVDWPENGMYHFPPKNSRPRGDMKQLIKACKNLGSYLKAVILRRKRRKKEKEEDPYIYPIF